MTRIASFIALSLVSVAAAAVPIIVQSGMHSWSDPSSDVPAGITGNGGLVATDSTLFLAAISGPGPVLNCCDTATGTWTQVRPPLAPTPSNNGTSSATRCRIAASPDGGTVYVLVQETSTSMTSGSTSGSTSSSFTLWRSPATAPALTRMATLSAPVNGMYDNYAVAATASKVYAFLGKPSVQTSGSTNPPPTDNRPPTEWNFCQLDLAAAEPQWTTLSSPTLYPGAGMTMTYPGTGSSLWVVPGRTSEFWTVDVSSAEPQWMQAASGSPQRLPETVGPSAVMSGGGGTALLLPGGTSAKVHRFNGFSWSLVTTLPDAPGAGSGIAQAPGSATIHISRGGGFTDLWSFPATSGMDTALTPAPVGIGAGGAAAAASDGQSLLVLAGGGTKKVLRYSIGDDAWTSLTDITGTGISISGINAGAGLAAPGDGYFYATVGGAADKSLLRYDPVLNKWTKLAPLPQNLGEGARLVAADAGTLYAIRGLASSKTVDLHRYSIADNAWTSMSPLPVTPASTKGFGAGAALAYPGSGDHLYALLGGGSTAFWRYSIPGNSWDRPEKVEVPGEFQDAPEAPDKGSVLAGIDGGRHLYAFRGGVSADTWSYDILAGRWTIRPAAPGSTGAGSSIVYPGSGLRIFALQGGSSKLIWSYAALSIPETPASLSQTDSAGLAPIPAGGSTRYREITVEAQLADEDGDAVMLQVEWKPVGAAFSDTGEGSVFTSLTRDGSAAATFVGLERGMGYRWRARAIDSRNMKSAWTVFGGDPDVASRAAVTIGTNAAPAAQSPGQFRVSTGGVLAVGGELSARDSEVRFEVIAMDPDGLRDQVRLEVEMRGDGTPFTNVATSATGYVASGSLATVSEVAAEGAHRWQYRVVDDLGEASEWTAFSAGKAFVVIPGGSLGASAACAGSASGSAGLAALLAVAMVLVGARLPAAR